MEAQGKCVKCVIENIKHRGGGEKKIQRFNMHLRLNA